MFLIEIPDAASEVFEASLMNLFRCAIMYSSVLKAATFNRGGMCKVVFMHGVHTLHNL